MAKDRGRNGRRGRRGTCVIAESSAHMQHVDQDKEEDALSYERLQQQSLHGASRLPKSNSNRSFPLTPPCASLAASSLH